MTKEFKGYWIYVFYEMRKMFIEGENGANKIKEDIIKRQAELNKELADIEGTDEANKKKEENIKKQAELNKDLADINTLIKIYKKDEFIATIRIYLLNE